MLKKPVFYFIAVLAAFLSSPLSYSQSTSAKTKPQQQGKLFEDDAITDSDYLRAIERANEILETAHGDAEFGVSAMRLIGSIDNTKNRVSLILSNLKQASPNVRNQQMYRNMLLDLQQQLDAQNKLVDSRSDSLSKIQDHIKGLRNDTIFMSLIKDTVRRKQFSTELHGLKSKYISTDSIIKNNMRIMGTKKRLVVDAAMASAAAMLTVEKRLEKTGVSLFGNEYPYLWHSGTVKGKNDISQNIQGKWDVEKSVVAYYTSYSFHGLVRLVFFMALLTWYIARNLNYLKTTGQLEKLQLLNFKYLNKTVWMPIAIITLNIAIVTNLYAPALFVEFLQLILLGVLTVAFKSQWPKRSMHNWLFIVLLFIILCFLDLFVSISFVERCIFIIINILGIGYGILQFKSIQNQLYIKGFFKWASFIFITLNVFSLFANLFGRVSLSHTFSLAAIIALTQIIALSVLLKIVLEIILLQIFVTRARRGIERIFDHENLSDTLKKPFVIVISYMWFIVIASNLNIWESLRTWFATILQRPITIGSVTFTLAGVLLFFVIVWIAHMLQKYVAYFFGEVDEDRDEENINKRQHSKLLVTRLIVLIVGYLLAVAASGMPMDKLSIVIGALGVGVGLGLQNIVTNFVSGIILIFDRPIQVGDIIEVSSQSGRVKSIGLRSTKINSAGGAEIIIPNGNILSQNITNWTYTDNLKLVEIEFTVTGEISTDQINTKVLETLQGVPLVEAARTPQIFYNAVSDGNYKIFVKFWCSIYRTEEVLSNSRQALYSSFKKEGITVVL